MFLQIILSRVPDKCHEPGVEGIFGSRDSRVFPSVIPMLFPSLMPPFLHIMYTYVAYSDSPFPAATSMNLSIQ